MCTQVSRKHMECLQRVLAAMHSSLLELTFPFQTSLITKGNGEVNQCPQNVGYRPCPSHSPLSGIDFRIVGMFRVPVMLLVLLGLRVTGMHFLPLCVLQTGWIQKLETCYFLIWASQLNINKKMEARMWKMALAY